MESRDLRDIFVKVADELRDNNLEVQLIVVHDRETNSYECLYNELNRGKILVEKIEETIKSFE